MYFKAAHVWNKIYGAKLVSQNLLKITLKKIISKEIKRLNQILKSSDILVS